MAQPPRDDEDRERVVAEVVDGVNVGRNRSASQIQRDLLAAFRARGVEPPSDFTRISRLMAAGTARRGRRLKVAKEAASGLWALRRWLKDHQTPPER